MRVDFEKAMVGNEGAQASGQGRDKIGIASVEENACKQFETS